jgi:uncharacterized protein DUF4231
LGVFVPVIASILGLLQLQEHWIKYRAAAESLRKEKFLFLTQTEPYDKDNAFHLLVHWVEALLSKENTEWAQSMKTLPKAEKVPEILESRLEALLSQTRSGKAAGGVH